MQLITNEKWMAAVSGGDMVDGLTSDIGGGGGGASGSGVTPAVAITEASSIGGASVVSTLASSTTVNVLPAAAGSLTLGEASALTAMGSVAAAGVVSAGLAGYQLGTAAYNNSTIVQNAAIATVGAVVSGINSVFGTKIGK